MKTYLVTGGAGFIGSNFVKYLLSRYGDEVKIVVVDSLTYAGNLATLEECLACGNVEFIKADIRDREAMKKILKEADPDYVVNFAAESHVDRSISSPGEFLSTNVMGTQTLLDCLRKLWITPEGVAPGKKYLQISTDEVYGSLTRDYDSPQPIEIEDDILAVASDRADAPTSFGEKFFTESTPLAPKSPYSASKAAADFITLAYSHTYGLPVNITRCSNNYGPAQFPEKLIPLVINNVLHGKAIPVYGRGLNVRDWLYVDDHCKAIDMVLRKGELGKVYNIGGFNEKANIDIVKEIIATLAELTQEPEYADCLKCSREKVNESLITYVTDRPGHDMRYAIDPSMIVRELSWYPSTAFTKGIRKTIRWYLDNPDWLEAVTSGNYQNYYNEMYSQR